MERVAQSFRLGRNTGAGLCLGRRRGASVKVRPAVDLVLTHRANAGLRQHREARHSRPGFPQLAFPEDVDRPYDSLGTHPDLVTFLWDRLGKAVPVDCRAIAFGTPALIHPESGIVFA